MFMKNRIFVTLLCLVIGLMPITLTSCGGGYDYEPTPQIPDPPVVFGNTMEANFFFSYHEYEMPSISWYTYYSRDSKNWSSLTPSNFEGIVAQNHWSDNPTKLGYYYDKTVKKEYLFYPMPTKDIVIKQFVIYENKKLKNNIFIAVKTLPEDKSDTIFTDGFTRELIPVSLIDSLRIGKEDSIVTKFGNKKIMISYTVEKFNPIKTALATYDSKNGLSYVLDGGPVLDSCIFQITNGEISFSKNLTKNDAGYLYLYLPAYGRNAKLISVKTVK